MGTPTLPGARAARGRPLEAAAALIPCYVAQAERVFTSMMQGALRQMQPTRNKPTSPGARAARGRPVEAASKRRAGRTPPLRRMPHRPIRSGRGAQIRIPLGVARPGRARRDRQEEGLGRFKGRPLLEGVRDRVGPLAKAPSREALRLRTRQAPACGSLGENPPEM